MREHEYRDLRVLVILILSIRICFVLRASDFGFGFELALCPMPYALCPAKHPFHLTHGEFPPEWTTVWAR